MIVLFWRQTVSETGHIFSLEKMNRFELYCFETCLWRLREGNCLSGWAWTLGGQNSLFILPFVIPFLIRLQLVLKYLTAFKTGSWRKVIFGEKRDQSMEMSRKVKKWLQIIHGIFLKMTTAVDPMILWKNKNKGLT